MTDKTPTEPFPENKPAEPPRKHKEQTDKTPTELLVAEIPYLRAFAISLSGSIHAADDLVQDTLVKAWSKFDTFAPGTNLRAWLITILRNNFYSIYRKRRSEVQDVDGMYAEQLSIRGGQESGLEMHEFRHALEQLSDEHREVLLMVGVMGFSYEEAAEVCDVALGTVKSRVNRARARLAEILGLTSVEDIGPDPVNSGILNKPAKYF